MFGENREEREALIVVTVALVGGWLLYLAWFLG